MTHLKRVDLQDADVVLNSIEDGILPLDQAISKLQASQPMTAQLVKLRFFAGLSVDETADALGISSRTAGRKWLYARAWLRRELDSACGRNS